MSSTTQVGGISRTFDTGHTIGQYLAVSLNTDGQVVTATAGSTIIVGLTSREVVTAGDPATVQLLNGGGTGFVKLIATVTTGDEVYSATGGKVSPTNTGGLVGVALQGGGADDVIEVLFGSAEL